MRLHSESDVTHRKRVEDFGRFWKSQWVENWTPNETVGFRLLAETFVAGTTRVGGGGGGKMKSKNRKIVPLPPYVEEPLNSKVIKGFVPEQRSRQVFFVFRDPMFYVIYVIYVMNIPCTFHRVISWLWYNPSPCLFVLFFFHLWIVYVVSCVFVKKPTRRSDGHELVKEVEIVGVGQCHTLGKEKKPFLLVEKLGRLGSF